MKIVYKVSESVSHKVLRLWYKNKAVSALQGDDRKERGEQNVEFLNAKRGGISNKHRNVKD